MKAGDIEKRLSEALKGIELPILGPDKVCPECGSNDAWREYEVGYSRFTELERETDPDDGDYWHGLTDGWDDMSEGGMCAFLMCFGCDSLFEIEDIEAWD